MFVAYPKHFKKKAVALPAMASATVARKTIL
jgi:hypothetical protein